MPLPFAVSTSFSALPRPVDSFYPIRLPVYLCVTAVTQSSRTYTHPTDNIAITQVGPPFSHPRRFMTALGTYPENPTRLTFSRVQVIQYLSFPLASTIFIHSGSKPEQCGSPKESPPFGHLPGGFFVTWPHRSCFFHSPLIWWRFAGLYYILRQFSPSLPRYPETNAPLRDSCLDFYFLSMDDTSTPFPTLILSQPRFPVLETPP